MSTHPVLAGAEAVSHTATGGDGGVLALHGFTGSPSSMRGVATAMVEAGLHVEVPRLPGHGTDVTTWCRRGGRTGRRRSTRPTNGWHRAPIASSSSVSRWADRWRCGRRCDTRRCRGLVLVNPVTEPQPVDVREMLGELLADGMAVVPGIGSDIAEPGVVEIAYPETPLAPLISLLDDGISPADRTVRRADDAVAAVHVAPGPRRRSAPERAPRPNVRRRGRPPLAGAQLPRRHAGLRPARDHRRGRRVRDAHTGQPAASEGR